MQPAEICRGALDASACHAGSHALAGLLALLALAMVAAGFFAGPWQPPVPSAAGTAGTRRGARIERALVAAIAAAVLAFAMIAWGVARSGHFLAADRGFSMAAHRALSVFALQTFERVTWLGNGTVLAVLCIVAALALALRREPVLAIGIIAAIGGNGLLDAVLKRVFTRVRPPEDGALQLFHGWGFPSGHAAGAIVAYGFLGYLALRLLPPRLRAPCLMLAASLVLLVGASRVFINAHYASDVLAGFASGTAWLLACILVIERVREAPRPSADSAPEEF